MSQTRITPIFIPILSIPGLMGSHDNNKYFKDYSFVKLDVPEPINTAGLINPIQGRAIIDIVIRPEIKKTLKLKQDHQRFEQIIVKALIDTGAQISSIRKNKAKELKQRTFKGIHLFGMNKESSQHRNVNLSVNLCNRSNGFIDVCPVIAEFAYENEFDFIIGWDILRYCILSYDGTSKHFDLKFIGENQNK